MHNFSKIINGDNIKKFLHILVYDTTNSDIIYYKYANDLVEVQDDMFITNIGS